MIRYFLVAALLALQTTFASAANVGGCHISEFKSNVSYNYDVLSALNYSKAIENESSERVDKNVGLNVIWDRVPIGATKESRSKNFQRYSESINYNYTVETATAYVGNYLDSTGLRAYLACLSRDRRGLTTAIARATDSEAILSLQWRKYPGGNDKQTVSLDIRGGRVVVDENISMDLVDDVMQLVRIERFENTELNVIVSGDIVSAMVLSLNKQFQFPDDLLIFRTRVWQDENTFDETVHVNFNEIWMIKASILPANGEFGRRQMWSADDKQYFFVDINNKGVFYSWIRMGALLLPSVHVAFGNRVNLGTSAARFESSIGYGKPRMETKLMYPKFGLN